MEEKSIQSPSSTNLAVETSVFASYLEQFGLPTDNIIASTDERNRIAINLPSFLESLSIDTKKDARYLSKFVGATAIGLFDAALNYVWNEVVLNLRKKAVIYDLDLFFDAAVGGKNREDYKGEKDLEGLKDNVLLQTCRKLELISDVVYRKLDFILTMRNEVAASHPNVEEIGGFELLGWLQTCVQDVLQDQLSDSAIRIKSLVSNLKSTSEVIDDTTLLRIETELKNLSLTHVNNLLITVFGIFTAPDSDQVLRRNISKIAPMVWECSADQIKSKIGAQIDGYRTNLHQEKLERGVEFLRIVDGLMYESLPSKTVALENLAELLEETHQAWDNFHHEPAIMREILHYCKSSTDIPKDVLPKLTKIVMRCRIGNGVSYMSGVSKAGLPLYNQLLSILDDEGVAHCIRSLFSPEINSKLGNSRCQKHLEEVLHVLKPIVISDRLRDSIDLLLKDIPNAYKANQSREFRELTAPFIKWPKPPTKAQYRK